MLYGWGELFNLNRWKISTHPHQITKHKTKMYGRLPSLSHMRPTNMFSSRTTVQFSKSKVSVHWCLQLCNIKIDNSIHIYRTYKMQQYTCQSFVLKLIKDSYFGSVLLLTHYNVTSVIKLTQFIDILSVAAQCIKTKQYKNRTNRSYRQRYFWT